jgi:hypothetical protein
MAKKSTTGDPTPYTDADEAAIEAAIDSAWQQYEAAAEAEEAEGEMPSNMRVSAQIEWAGVLDRARDGHRTTRLDGLDQALMKEVKKALDRARQASQRTEQARPATSYRAKGWQAQLRQLNRVQRGAVAAERAGLSPSQRTMREWTTGRREPNKQNRELIAKAYDELRNWRVNTTQAAATAANKDVADRLTDTLRERYGAEIRLRNITQLDLEL